MAARSLSIEVSLGVTSSFAVGKVEAARVEVNASVHRRDDQTQAYIENQRGRGPSPSSAQIAFLGRSLDTISKRLDNLEKYVAADLEMKRKMAAENSQQDLLSPLAGQDPTKPPKKK
jgi:hypothetical protein